MNLITDKHDRIMCLPRFSQLGEKFASELNKTDIPGMIMAMLSRLMPEYQGLKVLSWGFSDLGWFFLVNHPNFICDNDTQIVIDRE